MRDAITAFRIFYIYTLLYNTRAYVVFTSEYIIFAFQ